MRRAHEMGKNRDEMEQRKAGHATKTSSLFQYAAILNGAAMALLAAGATNNTFKPQLKTLPL